MVRRNGVKGFSYKYLISSQNASRKFDANPPRSNNYFHLFHIIDFTGNVLQTDFS